MPSARTKQGNRNALLATVLATLLAMLLSGCGATTEGEDEQLGTLSEALCSGVKLAASPAGPSAPGTNVTLTASGVTCGAGETAEYRFFYQREGGTGASVEIRAYGTNPVAVWNTTGLPHGAYQVLVYVRPVGSTAQPAIVYLNPKYLIGNVCNDTTSFTTSPTPPQSVGVVVGLSSTAACTGGTPEFRYHYKAPGGSAYIPIGGWGPANQNWSTTSLPVGTYSLLVQTRAIGNLGIESTRYANYQLGSACSNAGMVATPAGPQPVGTQVTLTGSSTCGSPQYQFSYRLYGDPTWTSIGGFGAATQVWNTTGRASGLYQLLVGVRQAGSSGGAESTFIITYGLGEVCSTVTLATNPPSPAGVGATVQLTGAASCSGAATPEYQFSTKAPGAADFTTLQAYGTSATANWPTTGLALGTHTLRVQTRAVGSTSPNEASATLYYSLTTSVIGQVVAGLNGHVCARVTDGTARCWGPNDVGQLGTGSTSALSSVPVQVVGLTGVAAVSTGGYHSCALLLDHTVRCWGQNSDGQLGNGTLTPSSSPVVVTGLTDAVAISSGTYHNCALRTGGAVSCWGDNSYYETGGTGANWPKTTTPAAVPGISGATAAVAAGFHSCALVSGAVQCWGDNSHGQLGNGGTPIKSVTPVPVTGLSGVSSLSGGDSHSCAVVGGAIRCWGDNTYGQLGSAPSATPATTPQPVAGLTNVADVAAGFTFSCARMNDLTIRCWGRNVNGELGNGTGVDSFSPVAVSGIGSATSITAGYLNGCAILANNTTRCWGYGASGGLGNGTSAGDALTPTTVLFP
jgi:alpha-tubulin suppressor-like RCC1 family protein